MTLSVNKMPTSCFIQSNYFSQEIHLVRFLLIFYLFSGNALFSQQSEHLVVVTQTVRGKQCGQFDVLLGSWFLCCLFALMKRTDSVDT